MDESVIFLEDSPEVIDLSESLDDISEDFRGIVHKYSTRNKNNKKKGNKKKLGQNGITTGGNIDLTIESSNNIAKESMQEKEHERKSVELCCPICFNKYLDVQLKATKCGHVFCSDCIEMAIKDRRNCPTCRHRLTLKDLIPLYL